MAGSRSVRLSAWSPAAALTRRALRAPMPLTPTPSAGKRESEPPWEPRSFGWTCRSCDKHISDRGLIQGPADDELGHAEDCPRLAASVAEWNASAAEWAAEWEADK